MTANLEIVAEPARRAILALLLDGPRPVAEIVAETGLSQPNTSRHLRILREGGFVSVRPAGQQRVYGLRADGFAELSRWLAPYARLWQGRRDALQGHLD